MKTLNERKKLKEEFNAWKEELALWQLTAPSFRHHNPADYAVLKAEWDATKSGIIDMMNMCIAEAKA
jgi:hypothetical protein